MKLDTGMGRLGTRDRDRAVTVAERVLAEPSLALVGAMTHFATADADLEFVDTQLARFIPFVDQLRRRCPGLVVHAANSAATLRAPASHFDLVRCGIALYGCDPMQSRPCEGRTRARAGAALYVAAVKRADPGRQRRVRPALHRRGPTWIGTFRSATPTASAAGSSNDCEVLIGGRRYPLAGTVSMDNITVDLGPGPEVDRLASR